VSTSIVSNSSPVVQTCLLSRRYPGDRPLHRRRVLIVETRKHCGYESQPCGSRPPKVSRDCKAVDIFTPEAAKITKFVVAIFQSDAEHVVKIAKLAPLGRESSILDADPRTCAPPNHVCNEMNSTIGRLYAV
jgi:hypothetical protein